MLGNLFPSCNLKGNCTFTAQAATAGKDMAEENPGVEPEGEEVTEPSDHEEVEALGKLKETDQSIEYITHFANVVKLYQRKNKNCFRCKSPGHIVQDFLMDVSRPTGKVYLNTRERTAKKGGWAPHNLAATKRASPDKTS